MKSIVFVCIMILVTATVQAQTNELLIKSNSKGLYIDHKVTPKENFYSIGRLFNVHPKHLASFNSLDMTKGLGIGQIIRIPLTDTNFNQKTNKGIPVFYVTGNSEGLYRVSTNNNNILIDKLRQWNHLSGDNVAPGSKLVVGFLVSNGASSIAVVTPPKAEAVNKNNPENNKETAKNEVTVKEEKVEKPETKKEEVKQEKEEPKKTDEVVQVKQEMKPQNSSQGYFKTSFEQQIRQQPITKEQTLTSGIFKTASGWSDTKYYLLMDGLEPGIIVKITNPTNNKIIYAKLLGEMNGLKQNEGLNIRVSNAAASALGVAETDKFILKLNY
jgi:hypothetical protein